MKRILIGMMVLLSLVQTGLANNSGALFNVVTEGPTLTITTTIPNHIYPRAGIRLNTSGFSFTNSSDCTPNANGYCLFSVSNSSPKTFSLTGLHGHPSITLCLNGKGALSCQNYAIGHRYIYVTNFGSTTVLVCRVNSTTGALGSCVTAGTGFTTPIAIALNSTGTFAYVVNHDVATVSVCSINQTTGVFTGCTTNTVPAGTVWLQGIAVNSTDTIAYLGYDQGVYGCVINSNTGLLSGCSVQPVGSLASFGGALGLTLNSFDTLAYLVTDSERTLICNVVGAQIMTECSGGYLLGSPQVFTLNTSNTLGYIPLLSVRTVAICPIGSNGMLNTAACNNTVSGIDGYNFAINTQGTLGYIGSYSTNVVSKCNINGSAGSNGVSGCVDAGGSGFTTPTGIVLQ